LRRIGARNRKTLGIEEGRKKDSLPKKILGELFMRYLVFSGFQKGKALRKKEKLGEEGYSS